MHRYLVDNKQQFEAIVVPHSCSKALLKLAHDDMGHNGSSQTYMLLQINYYWKGMKPHTYKYVKHCELCQKCNTQVVKYNHGHFEVPKAPMDFISMDLIGEYNFPHFTRSSVCPYSNMYAYRIHMVHSNKNENCS